MTDRRSEIPKDFSLREQAMVLEATYNIRKDFVEGRTRKRAMGDEERNIMEYNLAVLGAAARTLRELARSGKVVQAEPEQIQEVAPVVEEPPPAPPETSPPGRDDTF